MSSHRAVIEKLVHGGQGLATLEDGKKAFVWNALPGEEVVFDELRRRRDYVEGVATEVIKPSPQRIEPVEANYLSTSPWQIMTFEAENDYKAQIINETFERAKVALPDFKFESKAKQLNYRNKMEYSFWGDEQGLHLALHRRGSRGKDIVGGSKLAMPAVDEASGAMLQELIQMEVRAGSLKTIMVRCNQQGQAVASLFVKQADFPSVTLPKQLQGLRVYYSEPKSPASVATKLLQETGSVRLPDKLLGKQFEYSADSFFQVNLPIFETALQQIKKHIKGGKVIDMYGGVGTIGASAAGSGLTIIESDKSAIEFVKLNVSNAKVIHAKSEQAIDYLDGESTVIVDPPRAGLHKKVISRLQQVLPPQIVYLSCNPATQVRDIELLQNSYNITFFEGYNFFPRTPHIESLAILQRTVGP